MDLGQLHEFITEGTHSTNWTDAVKANSNTHYSLTGGNMGHHPSILDSDLAAGALAREEQLQKAPKILPFQLSRLHEHYAEVYINLRRSKNALLNAHSNGLLNTDERELVKKQMLQIKTMMKQLSRMAVQIDELRM